VYNSLNKCSGGIVVKLKIKRLAQIEDSEIEVKPFTIFFGESNTNKSYTLFALYSLNMLKTPDSEEIEKILKDIKILSREESTYPSFYPKDVREHIPPFGRITVDASSMITLLKENFRKNIPEFFKYLISTSMDSLDVELEIEEIPPVDIYYHSSENFIICIENEALGLQTIKARITPIVSGEEYLPVTEIPNAGNSKTIEEEILYEAIPYIYRYLATGDFYPRYHLLPPARGSFFDIQFSLLKLLAEDTLKYPITGLVREFIKTLPLPLGGYEFPESDERKKIEELLTDISGGNFSYNRATGQLIYSTPSGEIPLSAASSSVKELAPLYFILKTGGFKEKKIFIEEPEAHLHPSLQIKVAYLLSSVVKMGGKVFLTTHSDYFMGALNNLIKLWNIRKLNPELANSLMKKYDIKEEYLVSPQDIAVYLFKRCENHRVKVERINIGRYGIPLVSFRDTFKTLASMTEELHYELFNLEESNIESSEKRS